MTIKSRAARAALLVAASTVAAAAAQATVFAGTATLTAQTNANRLTVTGTPNPAPFATANLSVGQSSLIDGLMTIRTDFNTGGCILGCTASDNVTLTFNFTSPGAATASQGGEVTETAFSLAGILDSGSITWAGATNLDLNGFFARQQVTFGNGAVAMLDVYNTLLSGSGSSRAGSIDVRIRDVRDPATVPEPASWAMFIGGFGLVGAAARRRKAIVSFA